MLKALHMKLFRYQRTKGQVATMLCLVAAALLFVLPDEPSTKPSTPGVAMQCVDAEGKPVAGAEVYLFQSKGGAGKRYVGSAKLTTDGQGRAICPDAIFSDPSGKYDRWMYARVPGRLVGAARSTRWPNRKPTNPEGRIEMVRSCSVEGRVSVPKGFDPTKVSVQVRTLHILTGSGPLDYQSFPRELTFPGLDTALPQIFECRPDATGKIRFDDIPERGRLYLFTKAEGLGEAQWMNQRGSFDVPIALELGRESFVSGLVLTPDGKPAPGMKVSARLAPRNPGKTIYLSSFETVTDANGLFTIHGLPETEFSLRIEDSKKTWTFRPIDKLIRSQENQVLTLSLERGNQVTGRVLDQSGKPVAGAGNSAAADGPGGSGLDHGSTDPDGCYRLVLPSGTALLYFNSVPEGFVYPNPQIVKELVINPGQAEVKDLDFVLQRANK
jgi:hypothetical protein